MHGNQSILTLLKVLNFCNRQVWWVEDFIVSDAVLSFVDEAIVEFRERLLKTAIPKTIKELMKMITGLKGCENENTELDLKGVYSGKENNRVDGDSAESKIGTVGLLKQIDNVAVSKLAKRCQLQIF